MSETATKTTLKKTSGKKRRRKRSSGGRKSSKRKTGRGPSGSKIPSNQKNRVKKKKVEKIGDYPKMRTQDGFEPNREVNLQKKIGVIFFASVAEAISKIENIKKSSAECEQLNIVIKQEGNREIPELEEVGKVFLGEAWHIIHTRRQEDGFYQ